MEGREQPRRSEPEASGAALRRAWEARRGQFAADARVSRSPLKRALWVSAGFVSLGLGIVGVVLPVLPTTPLVILAAACFARSSTRFYNAVLSHRVLGPIVYEWRERRTIPRRAKASAIALIVITFTLSIVFVVPLRIGQIALGLLGVSVIAWLLTIPSRD